MLETMITSKLVWFSLKIVQYLSHLHHPLKEFICFVPGSQAHHFSGTLSILSVWGICAIIRCIVVVIVTIILNV